MNGNKKLMPEALYSLDREMSLEKLNQAQKTEEFIVGYVTSWDSVNQSLRVNLGNNILGSIPLDEISIYPTSRSDKLLSPEVYSLIGHNVCVCVLEVNSSSIILSRKQNMLKAFNAISELTGETIDCYIKSLQKKSVFVDVGHGISGMIYISDLCSSKLHNASDIGIESKDIIKVKISYIDYTNFFTSLSYKDMFEDLSNTLNIGDFVETTVLDPINSDGYFAYINPSTPAIVNPPDDLSLSYGTRIVARVKSFNAKGKLKLSFISFI